MNKQLEIEISAKYPDRLTWQKKIATFHPECEDEIVYIFDRMREYKQEFFISGFGNYVDPVGEKFANLLVIKSDRLNNIVSIDKDAKKVTVGSGYPLKEINKELAGLSLWLPFGDSNYPGSFGGALAMGLTAKLDSNTVRLDKFLSSVKVVNEDGSMVEPDKNSGKFDRIFSSHGNSGFIFNLTFDVVSQAEREAYSNLILQKIS